MPIISFYPIPQEEIYLGADKSSSELIAQIKEKFLETESEKLESKAIELASSYEHRLFQEVRFKEGKNFEGFQITPQNSQRICEIAEQMARILQTPELVFEYLQDLDQALAVRMAAHEIEPFNNSPSYLICGAGNFIPGPWPQDYQPLNKRRQLSEELLHREQECGINLEGVAVFTDAVEGKVAARFAKAGNIFSEVEQNNKFLFHGKFSHRLFFEIVRQASKRGDLDLTVDGQELTQRQLLQIMNSTHLVAAPEEALSVSSDSEVMWNRILDTTADSSKPLRKIGIVEGVAVREGVLNPNNYSFSCRSPFVLKSLITCFGKEKLPNLCGYMLDGHYKQVAQMVCKLRSEDVENSLGEVPDQFIYQKLMIAMSTGRYVFPGDVGERFSFTQGSNKALKTTPLDEEKYGQGVRLVAESAYLERPIKYESLAGYSKIKSEEILKLRQEKEAESVRPLSSGMVARLRQKVAAGQNDGGPEK